MNVTWLHEHLRLIRNPSSFEMHLFFFYFSAFYFQGNVTVEKKKVR